MSAPNAGRQSPEPDRQAENQSVDTHSGTAFGDPSGTGEQDSSEGTKHDDLESNPKGPLDDAAKEKVSKEGRGVGI
ncbi:hypothetical protein MMC20_002048 [Loxospora ochrophaea]|nr:hypothetical protein [Loxospora ochrophaea]